MWGNLRSYSLLVNSFVISLAISFLLISCAPSDETLKVSDLHPVNEEYAGLFEDQTNFSVPRTLDVPNGVLSGVTDYEEVVEKVRSIAEIVLLINKAERGPTAQTLTFFKDGVELDRFYVSTGRERLETKTATGRTYRSVTPVGFYRPKWLAKDYHSRTWDAPMPYSIFFIGGVALHATFPKAYDLLGQRGSGGCVRMKMEAAEFVFNEVEQLGRGEVPLYSRSGVLQLDLNGHQKTWNAYRAMVVVVDVES